MSKNKEYTVDVEFEGFVSYTIEAPNEETAIRIAQQSLPEDAVIVTNIETDEM